METVLLVGGVMGLLLWLASSANASEVPKEKEVVDPTLNPLTKNRTRPVAGSPTPWSFAQKYGPGGGFWKEILAVNPNLYVRKFNDATGKIDPVTKAIVQYEGIAAKPNNADWGSPTFPLVLDIPKSWSGGAVATTTPATTAVKGLFDLDARSAAVAERAAVRRSFH